MAFLIKAVAACSIHTDLLDLFPHRVCILYIRLTIRQSPIGVDSGFMLASIYRF